MPAALDPWLSRLKDTPYAVLGRCAEEIDTLLSREGVKNRQLADVISHDPLLCARLFRAANRDPAGQLGSVEQATAVIGEEMFRSVVTSGPLLEETLRGAALAAYVQALRRAYHAGALARHLATAQGYAHPQEFFFAGLLYGVGDLALRAVDPTAARLLDEDGESEEPAEPSSGGAQIPAPEELSQALATEWHLPELVHRAHDVGDEDDRKASLVRLAVQLVSAGCKDLHAEAQGHLLEQASFSADLGLQYVLRDVYQCSLDTARALLDWYPVAIREGSFIPFYPGPYKWPERAAPMERTVPAGRPSTAPAGAPAGAKPRTPQRIVEDALSAMHAKLGLRRVVFATLSKDRKTIKGHFYRGVDPDSPLRRFEFQREGASLFARLLNKPQHVRVHAGNRDKLAPFITMEIRRILGERDFCASSIFVRSRPVGLCYADTYPDQDGLDEGTYQKFKGLCSLIAKRLTEVSAAASAQGHPQASPMRARN